MVSNARDDFPLPESPVTTTITSRGKETVMSFRLCSRAPRTTIWLSAIFAHPSSQGHFSASIRPPVGRPKNQFAFHYILAPENFIYVATFAIFNLGAQNDTRRLHHVANG